MCSVSCQISQNVNVCSAGKIVHHRLYFTKQVKQGRADREVEIKVSQSGYHFIFVVLGSVMLWGWVIVILLLRHIPSHLHIL